MFTHQIREPGFKTPLNKEAYRVTLGQCGFVYQPNLPHRVLVWIKWGKKSALIFFLSALSALEERQKVHEIND